MVISLLIEWNFFDLGDTSWTSEFTIDGHQYANALVSFGAEHLQQAILCLTECFILNDEVVVQLHQLNDASWKSRIKPFRGALLTSEPQLQSEGAVR